MAYATPAQFVPYLGARRLEARTNATADEQRLVYEQVLSAAPSQMDQAFSDGGYAVPISATGDLAARLAVVCMCLAAGSLAPQTIAEDRTIDQAYKDALAWLKDIASGSSTLPGIAIAGVEAGNRHAGRVRFVEIGNEPSGPPRRLYRQMGGLYR